MDSTKPSFTALTCTYNRANLLHRPYASLKAQTCRNFEWIVYNNGSNDNTEELVKQWAKEADFPIRYMSRPDNAGIQNAYREGVNSANGEFWFLMDSDDELVPEALQTMSDVWLSIPAESRHKYSGVTVNCIDQHGQLVGNEFPSSPLDSTIMETTYRFGVEGEKFGVIRVDVLKEFPFQDVKDHVQPLAIWGMINTKYKTRYANEKLRVYWIDEPGRYDQLSRNASMMKLNAYGGRLNCQYIINHELSWFMSSPVHFVKAAVFYKRYSEILNIRMLEQIAGLKSAGAKILYVASTPIEWLQRHYMRFKFR